MTENSGFWPLSGKLIIQSSSNLYTVGWVFRIDLLLGHFFGQILGPLLAKNWLETVFFNHYLEYWSLNLFQTWCTNWLREFSEMIGFGRIGQILALRWPSLYFHSFLIRHQAGMCILRFLRIIPHGILFIFPYSRYQAQMALQKQQFANKLATSARKRRKLEVRLL